MGLSHLKHLLPRFFAGEVLKLCDEDLLYRFRLPGRNDKLISYDEGFTDYFIDVKRIMLYYRYNLWQTGKL